MSAPSPEVPGLRALMRGSRGTLAGAVGLSAIATGAGVALLLVSAWLITAASFAPPILTLTPAVVAVRALGISRGVFRYAERLVGHDAALRFLAAVRTAVYGRLTRLVPAGTRGLSDGEVLGRFVADTDALADLYVRVIVPVGGVVLVWAGLLLTAVLLDPDAALVLLAVAAVGSLLAPWLTGLGARRAEQAMAAERGLLNDQFLQLMRGSTDILTCDAGGRTLTALAGTERRLARAAGRSAGWVGIGAAVGTAAVGVGVVAMLEAVGPDAAAGRISGPVLAVLVFAVLATQEPSAAMPPAAAALRRVRASARRVRHLLAHPVVPGGPLAAPPADPVLLAAEDLCVRWSPSGPATVTGITLSLGPQSSMAVVGPSGGGKSTLLLGLLGLLPVEGTLRIAGATRPAEARGAVTAALQEAHLFDTTVRENLRLADPAVDDAELFAVLRRVRLDGWLAGLPRGLDTLVGEGGIRLSGGQRQRLSVARALLSGAPVLLLDEPGEHLDSATADRLLADLLTAAADRAVLVISHRLAPLTRVDEVLVLQDGGVIERGTHEELLAAGGWYARTWAAERAAEEGR